MLQRCTRGADAGTEGGVEDRSVATRQSKMLQWTRTVLKVELVTLRLVQ